MSTLENLSLTINSWIEFLLFGLGFSMALIVAAQVFFRYVLNSSLFWSEELARYMLVWLTFLGTSVAYRRKAHPGIDIAYSAMRGNLKKTALILTHFFSLFLFGVMIVYGFNFSYFVRFQVSPALNLPKWIIFGIIPISGLILVIHCLAFFMSDVKRNEL